MLKQGIIEPSTSSWSSPIILVEKKDESPRFCVDFRKLNNVPAKDAYPLPNAEELIDELSGSRWFSTLDLASGYWQVELDPIDREKTAFTFHGKGLFYFKVMCFWTHERSGYVSKAYGNSIKRNFMEDMCCVHG